MANNRNGATVQLNTVRNNNKIEHGNNQDTSSQLDKKYKLIATLTICFGSFVYVSH